LRIILVERVGLMHVQQLLHRDLVGLPGMDHLDQPEVLDRVTALRGAAWGLMFGMWGAVAACFNVIRLAVLVVLLATANPWLIALLPCAAATLWCDRRGQHAVNTAEIETAQNFRLQRHLYRLATNPDTSKELRVARVGEEIAKRQLAAWNKVFRTRLRARVRAAGWKLAGWTLFTAGFVAGLVLVVWQAATGLGTVGDIVLAITVAVTLRQSVQDALRGVNDSMASGRTIEPYLWLRDYVATARADRGTSPVPAALRHGITFDRVGFTDPGADRPTLTDVSCHLPAGSVVAIVGEYGSGKTTLIKLLCRFYSPAAGTIRIDDTNLDELPADEWRKRTSAAFQDFGRFQTTFATTVGLGDLPYIDDLPRIGEAVRAADAQILLDRLPGGLDTQLGQDFGGVELSEGQWQKTALARSSMRPAPLLFVLDEPTASLDAPSEHAIFTRYMARARELAARTGAVTVVVSHRFSTVADADQILVLDKGKLVQAGPHDELLARGGRYADLYRTQADAYTSSEQQRGS
jgi:ABC-type multidrug transport system fused ATPase/permease subunit